MDRGTTIEGGGVSAYSIPSFSDQAFKKSSQAARTKGVKGALRVGDFEVENTTSGRSEHFARNLVAVENLYKGRELFPSLIKTVEAVLQKDDGGKSLVSAIRALKISFIEGEVDKIQAAREFGKQTASISIYSKRTEEYSKLGEDDKNHIDHYESKLTKSLAALEEAEKEGESLLHSLPSMGDLYQKTQMLSKAREAVEKDAEVLLVCLTIYKLPQALSLMQGTQANTTNQSQDDAEVGTTTNRAPSSVQPNQRKEGEAARKNDPEKMQNKAAQQTNDSIKQATQKELEKGKEKRDQNEKNFFAAEGSANAQQREDDARMGGWGLSALKDF